MTSGVYERTPETLEKIRQNGLLGAEKNRGRKLPPRTPRHIYNILISRRSYVGKGNPQWKGGGKSYLRKLALERDNHKCQRCGYRNDEFGDSSLDVDHNLSIKKFPQLKMQLDNLITLCPNCHRLKTLREKDHLRREHLAERMTS